MRVLVSTPTQGRGKGISYLFIHAVLIRPLLLGALRRDLHGLEEKEEHGVIAVPDMHTHIQCTCNSAGEEGTSDITHPLFCTFLSPYQGAGP